MNDELYTLTTPDSAIFAYHRDTDLDKRFVGFKELEIKLTHIYGMTEIALEIARQSPMDVDIELLRLCALHHDDGRVVQYAYLKNFNDRMLSHNELGLMMVNHWLTNSKIAPDESIQVLRDVMVWHGRQALAEPGIIWYSRPYIEIISDADDIENGCIGAVGYLLDECQSDAKGYNEAYPEHIGKIKEELWAYYESGTWFNKMTYCQSNAEYVLFAATLAMKSIVKYGDIAISAMLRPSYGYSSALEGYADIFENVMSPEDAKRAIQILRKACHAD